jgi:hypothetical protein
VDYGEQAVAVRFDSVTIPRMNKIISAHVQFTCNEVSYSSVSLNVFAERSATPDLFYDDYYDITYRTPTFTSVLWQPVPWTASGEETMFEQTADIASVLQEVVNLPTWVSGSSIVVIIRRNATDPPSFITNSSEISGRWAKSGSEGTGMPVLRVLYTTSGFLNFIFADQFSLHLNIFLIFFVCLFVFCSVGFRVSVPFAFSEQHSWIPSI